MCGRVGDSKPSALVVCIVRFVSPAEQLAGTWCGTPAMGFVALLQATLGLCGAYPGSNATASSAADWASSSNFEAVAVASCDPPGEAPPRLCDMWDFFVAEKVFGWMRGH